MLSLAVESYPSRQWPSSVGSAADDMGAFTTQSQPVKGEFLLVTVASALPVWPRDTMFWPLP